MKKDRNCGAYPYMYGMPGPLPMGGVQMPTAMPVYGNTSYTTSEINTLSNQVNNLEQRVSNLENMVNKSYSSNYNASNYQVM